MSSVSSAQNSTRALLQTNQAADLTLKRAQTDFLFLCDRIEMCANWVGAILRAGGNLRVR